MGELSDGIVAGEFCELCLCPTDDDLDYPHLCSECYGDGELEVIVGKKLDELSKRCGVDRAGRSDEELRGVLSKFFSKPKDPS